MLPKTLSPAKALAWSEAVLDDAENRRDRPALALWLPDRTTAAIGLSQRPEIELDIDAMRRDGVGLVRRQSGGGAVLLYDGVMCWEAWTSVSAMREAGGDGGIRHAYAFLSAPILAALRGLGLQATRAGICDISVAETGGEAAKKLAGAAQLRRKEMVLVHGSLLVAPDLDALRRYLRFPSEQPDYRRGRSHRDFCVTVREALSRPDSEGRALAATLAEAIANAAVANGWDVLEPPDALPPGAASLETTKYASPPWNWFRTRAAQNPQRGAAERKL